MVWAWKCAGGRYGHRKRVSVSHCRKADVVVMRDLFKRGKSGYRAEGMDILGFPGGRT